MSYPKIEYPAGSGSPTTVTFAFPPVETPAYWLKAKRHDNYSDAGVRESIVEGIYSLQQLNMKYLVAGGDTDQWNRFMQFALTGGLFAYYSDASNPGSAITYQLDDKTWKVNYKSPGMYEFNINLRFWSFGNTP